MIKHLLLVVMLLFALPLVSQQPTGPFCVAPEIEAPTFYQCCNFLFGCYWSGVVYDGGHFCGAQGSGYPGTACYQMQVERYCASDHCMPWDTCIEKRWYSQLQWDESCSIYGSMEEIPELEQEFEMSIDPELMELASNKCENEMENEE